MDSSSGGTLRQKLDRFWAALFLTEDGRPKSASMLYSFCLSLVFLTVYALLYGFLIDWLETQLASQSVPLRNLFESVVPGLAGTLVCCPLFFAFKDRRLVPAAYLWLIVYALVAVVTMLFLTSGEEFKIFLYFFGMFVPVGLVSGALASFLLLRRFNRRKEREKQAC